MTDVVIAGISRSPIGRAFKGSLKGMRPEDMAAQSIRHVMDSVPGFDATQIEDLLLGTAEPEGEHGTNFGRRLAVQMGWDGVPGSTTTRFCASSVNTTRSAFHAIKAGEGKAFLSVGVEAVSRYKNFTGPGEQAFDSLHPMFDDARSRSAERATKVNLDWADPREQGQIPDIYIAMGQTAENVAALTGITRHEMDVFAVRSQNNAERAIADGFFAREIGAITLPDGTVVAQDDCPRMGVTLESVSALQPAFRPEGRVTAANCTPLNDGAAATLVMERNACEAAGLTPLARIVSTGVSALSPEIMGLGPVEASRQALARAGLTIEDMDIVEINEAFAAQVIPSYRKLGISDAEAIEKVNPFGGAIALGHPFGQTGIRMMATLLNGLKLRDGRYGLVTMCVGGGQGMAIVLERL